MLFFISVVSFWVFFFDADVQVYFAMRYNLNVIGTIAQYVAVLFLFILTSDL